MKRIAVVFISVVFIALLFFQFSCAAKKEGAGEKAAGVEKKAAEVETKGAAAEEKTAEVKKETAKAEEKVAGTEKTEGTLLADKHKAAGNQCSDCHAENPPAQSVPTATCLGCHEDYKDQAASYIDPHSAHVEFTECGDCHHAHKESENQCLSCHTFNLKAP